MILLFTFIVIIMNPFFLLIIIITIIILFYLFISSNIYLFIYLLIRRPTRSEGSPFGRFFNPGVLRVEGVC